MNKKSMESESRVSVDALSVLISFFHYPFYLHLDYILKLFYRSFFVIIGFSANRSTIINW